MLGLTLVLLEVFDAAMDNGGHLVAGLDGCLGNRLLERDAKDLVLAGRFLLERI